MPYFITQVLKMGTQLRQQGFILKAQPKKGAPHSWSMAEEQQTSASCSLNALREALCPTKLPRFTSAQHRLSQHFPSALLSTDFYNFSAIPGAWEISKKLTSHLILCFKTRKDFHSWLKKPEQHPRRKPMQLVHYIAHKCLSKVNTSAKSRHGTKNISNKVKRGL